MNGLAGCGKTTIAYTIASWCDHEKILGASFFCARTGGRSDVQLIFPTIAYQLCRLNTSFAEEVAKALDNNPDIHRSQPSVQLEKLIVKPLQAVTGTPFPDQVVIIDALDECRDDAAISVILVALSRFVEALRPLKFIITSRPEPRIVDGFRGSDTLLQHTHTLFLNEVPPEIVDRDIAAYIEERLASIRKMYPRDGLESWPTEDEKKRLTQLTGRIFVFISTALNFIADKRGNNPRRRLEEVLNKLRRHNASPFAHLDELYTGVIDGAFADDVDKETVEEMKVVIGSVVLLRDQLTPMALDDLLGLIQGTSIRNLELIQSVVSLPQSDDGVIQIIHLSFPDFLVDPTRCTKKDLVVGPLQHHNFLARCCFKAMASFTNS